MHPRTPWFTERMDRTLWAGMRLHAVLRRLKGGHEVGKSGRQSTLAGRVEAPTAEQGRHARTLNRVAGRKTEAGKEWGDLLPGERSLC